MKNRNNSLVIARSKTTKQSTLIRLLRFARNVNSLGEGNTPLLRLYNLEKRLRWKGFLWAKAEYQNPTGSFKDRGSILEVTEALRLKKTGVVCASTGNMAASLAAYSAKAGLKCYVVVPKNTPPTKLKQALICGANLIEVLGNYDSCVDKAEQLAIEMNLQLCGDYKVRRIGQQSIGKELALSGIKFDAFICPVGNGTVGCAVAEGFAKYNLYPNFIGVQGKSADPITKAWNSDGKILPITSPATIASAMKVGNPLDGNLTLKWVKKTTGMMLSISDQEIIKAQKLLAPTEGIFIESSAAATIAALIILRANGVSRDEYKNTVLILTGSGLKEGGD